MSDPGKAVFLSYASQDKAAAQRICEALRAAGLEVWFDVSELRGGDAWDAKIRRQIKECTLFVPIISATTNSRPEGYFRLEWKLAVDRSHLLADDHPFLFPIAIGDVNDATARVPDKFREVQWTRLRLDETPGEVAARITRLLSGSVAGGADPGPASPRPATARTNPGRWQWWMIFPIAGSIMGMMFAALPLWRAIQGRPAKPAAAAVVAPAAPAPAVSPARELVAKVYPLIHGLEARREDFALAEDYCQRALKLAPDDGEVWAAYSHVHSAFGYRGWDTSPERREQTRVTAERAIRLAPQSVKARLAQAGAWSTFGVNREEREKLLRDIVSEEPDNKEALRFLAVTVLAKPNGLEEALALNERAAALPGGDPLALFNNGRYLWQRGRSAEGYATLRRALAQQKFTSALVLKMAMETNTQGDLVAAEETLRQIPGDALLEDRANYVAGQLRYYQRNGAAALATWQTFPRDFYSDFIYDGPKGLLLGLANELDHRDAAARTEWRAALLEVEKKIAAAPNRAGAYYSQAFLLACLGEKTAANEALRTYEQLAGIKYAPGQPMANNLAKVYARLGRFDEIFARPPETPAILRVSPDFAGLRADPRFAAWVAAGKQKAEDGGQGIVQAADEKSVAVLAFANLSDDKANEYFSDGISEELLNVLAKIPDLKVSARTSAFSFKGKEIAIPEIARQLGVAYVVEGSVRKQGEKVRITAQLIKAADGFHVWSDTFTRDLKDIFAVQDEIAGLIAQNLSLKLGMGSATAVRAVDPEAYRLMLLGRDLLYRGGSGDLEQAQGYLQEAVKRDEKFALAWAWLSITRWAQAANGWAPIESGFKSAREAAEQALVLQPDLPEANTAIGFIYYGYDWDWARAREVFQRAQALAPGNAAVLSNLTRLAITLGKNDEAVGLGRQAVALDPLSSYAQYVLSMALLQAGRYVELEQQVMDFKRVIGGAAKQQVFALVLLGKNEEALQVAGEFKQDNNRTFVLALANWAVGHRAEADAGLARLKTEYASTAAYQIAELHAYRGETDEAFTWLEVSYRQRDTGMIYLKNDPWLKTLHGDPRWAVLLRKMKLADEQLK